MKRYSHGSRHTKEKIVGIALGAIGLIIFINSIAIKFILVLIGIILLVMGGLLFMK